MDGFKTKEKSSVKKGFLILTVTLCLSVILSGCAYKDIDKRFFVVSIGIDEGKEDENKVELSLKFAIPQGSKDGESDFLIVTEEADTIAEAVRLIKSDVDKELDFAHAKLIVFGEEFATNKEKFIDYIDFFLRRRDVQKIAWVGIGKPNAKDVLNIKPKAERLPSNTLFLSFGEIGSESIYTHSKYLFELKRDLESEGVSAYIPMIEAKEKEQRFEINTISVLDKNEGELVSLSRNQTMIFNMLQEQRKSFVEIKKDGEKDIVSVEVINVNYDFDLNKDPKKIQLTMTVRGILEESHQNLSKEEREKIGSEHLKNELKTLLVKLQKEKVDPMGFGLHYRALNTGDEEEKIEKWKKIYPELEFDITVNLDVMGTGTIEG